MWKMGSVTRTTWVARARDPADGTPVLEDLVEAMLRVRTRLLDELASSDGPLTAPATSDPATRPLRTMPGLGAIVALTFRSAVDDPDRVPRIEHVGALGRVAPSTMALRQDRHPWADRQGRRSRGRVMLVAAAASILGRVGVMSPSKARGLRIAKRTCMKKAIVAVSRKRATILLAMWTSGTAYRATGRPPASARDVVAAGWP